MIQEIFAKKVREARQGRKWAQVSGHCRPFPVLLVWMFAERYAHWLEDRLWPAARALMRAS